jgi:hypothetical protein
MMTDQLLETEDISSTLAFCSEGYRRQVNTCGRERRQGRDKNYFSEETDQRSVDLRQRLVANSRFLRGPKKRQIDPLRQCLSGELRRLATAQVFRNDYLEIDAGFFDQLFRDWCENRSTLWVSYFIIHPA